MLIKRKSIEKEVASRRPANIAQAPVTISEDDGVRYLHFGTRWVQGAMRLRKPDWLELEYVQQMMAWMLFIQQPKHIVQLGLGAAALTKFCYRHFPDAQVTTIELNPSVIAVCRSMFKLPPDDDRLHVIEMDAMDFVKDRANHGTIDVLQADLYDKDAQGPVLDTPAFYQACANCLTPNGIMVTNLFGEHPSYDKNLEAMRSAFDYVQCLPTVAAGNAVALAFKRRPTLDFRVLYERALEIGELTQLPARQWVNGLKLSQPG
ncbi:MAG: spermidine synthase [Oxalobacter sp.]|nr:MAG: spermidine synthase [Oxalobacter sp.]